MAESEANWNYYKYCAASRDEVAANAAAYCGGQLENDYVVENFAEDSDGRTSLEEITHHLQIKGIYSLDKALLKAVSPSSGTAKTKLTKLLSLTALYQALAELQTRNVSVRFHWDDSGLPVVVQVSRFYITPEDAAAIPLRHDDIVQRYYLLKDIKKSAGYQRQLRLDVNDNRLRSKRVGP